VAPALAPEHRSAAHSNEKPDARRVDSLNATDVADA
jgi:hypothetical protein